MKITIVGHSTVLLEGKGTRLVTDPYFGIWGNPAYGRVMPPALQRGDLMDADGVLVSHSHWDHTDRQYFRGLPASTPVLVPSRTSMLLRLKGVRNAIPMREWESRTIGAAEVTAVPAIHLARTVGYVVRLDGVCVYFAGDTYHAAFMKEIGARFEIDVALMPVTTFRIPMTMGERGAVEAARDLRPRIVIPIHLGLRPRSPLLRTAQTPEGFERRLRDAGLDVEMVHPRDGEPWDSAAASQHRVPPSRVAC